MCSIKKLPQCNLNLQFRDYELMLSKCCIHCICITYLRLSQFCQDIHLFTVINISSMRDLTLKIAGFMQSC